MQEEIILVDYHKNYLKEVVNLFNQTIEAINRKDYTQEQLSKWLQKNPDYEKWAIKLERSETVLAINKDKLLVGFGNLSTDGIDCLYVQKDRIKEGIGKLLLDELVKRYSYQSKIVHVDASITARGFFEKNKFKLLKKNELNREGVTLINYTMVRRLE